MPGTQQVCSNYGKKRGGSDWTLAGGPGSDLASPLTYSELLASLTPRITLLRLALEEMPVLEGRWRDLMKQTWKGLESEEDKEPGYRA